MVTVQTIMELCSKVPEDQRNTTVLYFDLETRAGASKTIDCLSPDKQGYLARSVIFVRDPDFRVEDSK